MGLLTNRSLRQSSQNLKEKVLRCLNLDGKFYELPEMLKQIDRSVLEEQSVQRMVGRKGRFKSTILLQSKNEEMESSSMQLGS